MEEFADVLAFEILTADKEGHSLAKEFE